MRRVSDRVSRGVCVWTHLADDIANSGAEILGEVGVVAIGDGRGHQHLNVLALQLRSADGE